MIFKSNTLLRQLPYIVVEPVSEMKANNTSNTLQTSASVVVAPSTSHNVSQLSVPNLSRRPSKGSNR